MSESAHDIATVSKYFEKLNFPAQPLEKDTQEYLTKFFAVDGFIRLCDRIFGKYYFKHESERRDCWMDKANRNPRGNVAAELFKLLSPGSPFFLAIEAFSSPDSSFSSNLKYQWKTDSEIPDEGYIAHTIDFPLNAFLQSTKIIYECENTDLYRLTRSTCPAFMFIPFWMPPVVTRTERSQGRILTSLRCKPLPYFFIRLIFYLFVSTDSASAHLFTMDDLEGNRLAVFLKKMIQSETKIIKFPFYYNLTTAYIQYFVTPSIVRHFASKKRLEDVSWSTGEVSAGMLLCFSYFLSTRSFSDIDQEYRRGKRTDYTKLANIFGALPLLSELYIALCRDYECVPEPLSTIPPDFSADNASRSSNDIFFMRKSLYRNCLVSIREILLSLDDISKCRCDSITCVIDLWKALVNPAWRHKLLPSHQYIIEHIEAYIFILVDIMGCLSKSNYFHVVDVPGATALRETLEVLNSDVAVATLDQLRNSSHISLSITEGYVLNWRREDGSSQLPNMFSKECIPAVRRARHAIKDKMEAKGCSQQLKLELQKCLNEMGKLFPVELEDTSIDITQELLYHTPSSKSMTSTEGPGNQSRTNSDMYSSRLKENQRKHNFRWPTSNTCRDEVPVLVGLSKLFDCAIVSAQELLYFNTLKRCANGHKMWLSDTPGVKCSEHNDNLAVWSCAICETQYCVECKGFPTKNAETLEMNYTSSSCSHCNRFITDSCVSFRSSASNCVYCSSCASRPYWPYSSRWIASYRTLTVALLLVAVYFLFIF